MNMISRHGIDELIHHSGGPCISIYLPLHLAGAEIQADPLELKQLLGQVEVSLLIRGEPASQINELLGQLRERLSDRDAWRGSDEGRAMFIAPEFMRQYAVPLRLAPLAVVGETFHVLPVLSVAVADGDYAFLLLDKNGIRLFEGSRSSFREVTLSDVPVSLKDSMRYVDAERQLQSHSSRRERPSRGAGRMKSIFHGTGTAAEGRKRALNEFLREVDREVRRRLRSKDAPLVLGGVGYVLATYRRVSNYPQLLRGELRGNLSDLSKRELHEASWRIAESWYRQPEMDSLARLHQLLGSGRASTQFDEIAQAARAGIVESLLFADDDPLREIEGDVATDELLNQAAIDTLAHGGMVHNVPLATIGDGSRVAAVFRY